MRHAVDSRLTALEDRRLERRCRAIACADRLTPSETDEYVREVRQEVTRLRAGLRPRTLAEVLTEHADKLGLTGDDRAAFLADMSGKIEIRQEERDS